MSVQLIAMIVAVGTNAPAITQPAVTQSAAPSITSTVRSGASGRISPEDRSVPRFLCTQVFSDHDTVIEMANRDEYTGFGTDRARLCIRSKVDSSLWTLVRVSANWSTRMAQTTLADDNISRQRGGEETSEDTKEWRLTDTTPIKNTRYGPEIY